MTRHRTLGTSTKLAVYGVILAASFAAAAGVAAAVGQIDTTDDSHTDESHADQAGADHASGSGRPHVPGVSIDSDGFRIVPEVTSLATDAAAPYSFRIVDSAGDTVTDFDVTHERELHLIVVSRNFVDYHHLHPTQDTEGMWTADVPALPAGSYRVFADTRPTGADDITLGADLAVGNGFADTEASTAPSAGDTTVNVGGFEIQMTGTPAVGESTLTFSVIRDGEPIVPDPHLGASGHLVALRSGDLAFLHVHPLGDATPKQPAVRFAAELPTPGTYHLFLDFSIDDTVRTAAFTVEVPETNDRPNQRSNDNDTDHGQSSDQHETGH
jgi:hypothetical protein